MIIDKSISQFLCLTIQQDRENKRRLFSLAFSDHKTVAQYGVAEEGKLSGFQLHCQCNWFSLIYIVNQVAQWFKSLSWELILSEKEREKLPKLPGQVLIEILLLK